MKAKMIDECKHNWVYSSYVEYKPRFRTVNRDWRFCNRCGLVHSQDAEKYEKSKQRAEELQ